jgi:hypothetical protein
MCLNSAERRILEVLGNGCARPEEGLARGCGVADSSFVTDRQFMTAPSPAASEHGPSILALHAGAKSVGFGALTIIRLKCAFRHGLLFVSTARKTAGVGALSLEFRFPV